MVPRDYPIGAHTVTRSIAHIKGSKIGVHMIPQDRVADEGEDTEEEIDRFTFATEPSAQPSSSYAAHSRPVCLCLGSNHSLIISDR